MAKSFALAGAAAGAFAIKVGLDGVKSASDLNEEVSKAEVIFGDVSNEIKAFAKTADKALGLTQTEALKAASTFATFGKASGLAGKDLSKFSKGAATLASDLASFYNTNADEAITAIGAALRGEAEPIRKFGVLLNDSTLKAKAMEMGLYERHWRTGSASQITGRLPSHFGSDQGCTRRLCSHIRWLSWSAKDSHSTTRKP
jgi:hypothetical protein